MDPNQFGLQLATTALNTQGILDQGKADKASAEFQADSQFAAGTRKAAESRREADIVTSNARAAMAKNGGSAADAGAIETLSKIQQAGEYNAKSDMFEAETAADITRYEGKLKKQSAKTKAIGTVLSGGSSIYKSYKRK